MNRLNSTRWGVGLVLSLGLGASGCGGEIEQRRYYEATQQPDPGAPAEADPQPPFAGGAPAVGSGPMSGPVPVSAAEVAWTAPDGWVERPGDGVRLVTFQVAGRECTITAFPGDVGGINANVGRWLGQLNLPVPPEAEIDEFVAASRRVTTEGGLSGTILDFASFLPPAGGEADSMLAAVLKKEGSTVFVKLMGPRSVLAEESDRFTGLVRSIR